MKPRPPRHHLFRFVDKAGKLVGVALAFTKAEAIRKFVARAKRIREEKAA